MSKQGPPIAKSPGPLTRYTITVRVREDTINMIEFIARRARIDQSRGTLLDEKDEVVAKMPFVGNQHPQEWMKQLSIAISTAASVVKNLMKCETAVDAQEIQSVAEGMVRSVSAYLRNRPVATDGRKIVRTETDGAILAVQHDEVEVEGQESTDTDFKLSDETVEEADQAFNAPPPESEEANGEEGSSGPSAAEAPKRKMILKPGHGEPQGAKIKL